MVIGHYMKVERNDKKHLKPALQKKYFVTDLFYYPTYISLSY